MKTSNKKEKKLKAYGIFWKPEVMEDYGVTKHNVLIGVTGSEDDHGVWVRYALYGSKEEAMEFHQGNTDWEIKPVTITYHV